MAVETKFELIMVADAKLTDEESETIFDKFKTLINNNGGSVKHESSWGRRRLAYEIDKQQYGIYKLFYFEGNGPLVEELSRQFGYDDKITKFFIISVDDLDKSYKDFESLKADPYKNANLVKESMGA